VLAQDAYTRRVTRPEEDEAWRAIVDNYGDRVELESEPGSEQPDQPDSGTLDAGPRGLPSPSLFGIVETPSELVGPADGDRFVPPPPPPIPIPTRDRAIAWAGLFGSPTLLLVSLVLDLRIPTLIAYGLVAWFLGGFGYLVWNMPKGPADPWDDGARI
jgi:hypothetical protein